MATLIKVTTTTDSHGNRTNAERPVPLPGPCLFEPAQSVERTDPRSPGVTSPAKLYVVGVLPEPVKADDILEIDGLRWQVKGDGNDWSLGLEVALQRYGR